MNPRSRTQRSNSAALLTGAAPGDCGNWQTPTKLSGYKSQTRLMRSLQTRDHSRLVDSVPMWCAIAEARGEKNRQVRAALALQFELSLLQALADLVIADMQIRGLTGSASDL